MQKYRNIALTLLVLARVGDPTGNRILQILYTLRVVLPASFGGSARHAQGFRFPDAEQSIALLRFT